MLFSETQRPKKLIVFINPVGGKGQAREIYYNKVAQLFELAGIQTEITGKLCNYKKVAYGMPLM